MSLHHIKISDISVFKRVNFEKLEKLYLGDNYISDINAFSEANFKELKYLFLFSNNISDINALENVKFKELKELALHEITLNFIAIGISLLCEFKDWYFK